MADNITLTNSATGTVYNLGAGTDRLTLAGGTNVVTASDVESIVGGSGADDVSLTTATSNLVLDLGGFWTQVFDDLVKRPYIMLGFAAWLCLLPLAITSTRGWMRRLGRRWGQLHTLVYGAGVLAVAHYLWLVKADLREPLVYAAILAVLLGLRGYWRWRRRSPQGA